MKFTLVTAIVFGLIWNGVCAIQCYEGNDIKPGFNSSGEITLSVAKDKTACKVQTFGNLPGANYTSLTGNLQGVIDHINASLPVNLPGADYTSLPGNLLGDLYTSLTTVNLPGANCMERSTMICTGEGLSVCMKMNTVECICTTELCNNASTTAAAVEMNNAECINAIAAALEMNTAECNNNAPAIAAAAIMPILAMAMMAKYVI